MRINDAHKVAAVQPIYDKTAPKKATNLSINSNLLNKARSLNINLSPTLEQALEAEIRRALSQKWIDDNKVALANCNTLTEKNGLFADKHGPF